MESFNYSFVYCCKRNYFISILSRKLINLINLLGFNFPTSGKIKFVSAVISGRITYASLLCCYKWNLQSKSIEVSKFELNILALAFIIEFMTQFLINLDITGQQYLKFHEVIY